MTDDLRREIKRLTKEIDQLRDELAVERGEKALGELIVMRSGTHWGAPDTFHVSVAVSRLDVTRDSRGPAAVDHLLDFAKQQILRELGIELEKGRNQCLS